MQNEWEKARAIRQAARPLLITVISTLRPDLHPTRVGHAAEQLVLECEALPNPAAYWITVERILHELQS